MPAKSRHTSDRTLGASLGEHGAIPLQELLKAQAPVVVRILGFQIIPIEGSSPSGTLSGMTVRTKTEGCTRDRLCTYMANEQQALRLDIHRPQKFTKAEDVCLREANTNSSSRWCRVPESESRKVNVQMPYGCKQKRTLHPKFTFDQPHAHFNGPSRTKEKPTGPPVAASANSFRGSASRQ